MANRTAGCLFLAAVLALGNLIEWRWNPPPPRDRYLNDPGDWPFVAPWNMFSSRKWTPEVIRFHQKRMLFTLLAAPVLVASFILLDWIW